MLPHLGCLAISLHRQRSLRRIQCEPGSVRLCLFTHDLLCWVGVDSTLLTLFTSDKIQNKLHLQKVEDFSLPRRGGKPYHVAAYVPGAKVRGSRGQQGIRAGEVQSRAWEVTWTREMEHPCQVPGLNVARGDVVLNGVVTLRTHGGI